MNNYDDVIDILETVANRVRDKATNKPMPIDQYNGMHDAYEIIIDAINILRQQQQEEEAKSHE